MSDVDGPRENSETDIYEDDENDISNEAGSTYEDDEFSHEESDKDISKPASKASKEVEIKVRKSKLRADKGEEARLRVTAHRMYPDPGSKRKADIHTSPKKQFVMPLMCHALITT